MRALVAVFAHNELEAISQGLLRQICPLIDGVKIDVLLVNDGSNDGTAEEAAVQGFDVLSWSKNVGKAAAIKMAYTWFACHEANYNFFITMDGDGQHDPGELANLVRVMIDGADVGLGVRFHPDSPQIGTPDDRIQLNTMVAAEVKRRTGRQFHDVLCGFRGFSARAAQAIIPKLTLGSYGAELETVMTLARVFPQLNVAQVPISAVYRGTQAMDRLYGEQSIASRHNRLIERLEIHCRQLLMMEEQLGTGAGFFY